MKIVQFVFNESFWGKGLAYSQTVKIFIKCSEQDTSNLYELKAFVPLVNLIKERKSIKNFKKDVTTENFKLKIYPTLFLMSRIFLIRWWIIPFLFLNLLPYAIIIYSSLILQRHQIWHFRSYPIALVFSLFTPFGVKKVFDPRSDYILENRRRGIWRENEFSERIWFKAESFIQSHVDTIIAISPSMSRDLAKRNTCVKQAPFSIIYNPVDTSKFNPNQTFENDRQDVFLYSGSIGNWNKIENYLNFFQKALKVIPEAKFIILSQLSAKRRKKIEMIIDKYQFRKDSISLISPSQEELILHYQKAKWGLQLMELPDNRLGVKFVEYIAAGMIPIVNKNVMGAAEFCKANEVGIVIESDIDAEQLEDALYGKFKYKPLAYKKSLELIDESNVVKQTIHLYKSL